jgi:oligosaccharide repeat unit polymerase
MFKLTSFGFLFWLIVSAYTYFLSGATYFHLKNIWIPITPCLIFMSAWLVVQVLHSIYQLKREKQRSTTCLNNELRKIERWHSTSALLMIAIMAGVMYYISSALKISIFYAQDLRDAYYSSLSILGGSFFIWMIWIINSIIYYLLYMGIIFDINNKRPFCKTTIFALILVIMYSLITGGRIAIFEAAVIYIGSWVIFLKKIKLTKKVIRASLLTAFLLFGPLFLQQINRSDESRVQTGESTAVKYFIGPLFALDQFIENGSSDEIKAALGRVGVSFVGVDTILVSGLARGLLGLKIESAQAATSFYFHDGINISNNIVMNAQYTAGGRFYIDFGLVGYIFIYSFIAILCVYIDLRSRHTLTIYSPVLGGLIFLFIIYSSRELLIDSPAFLLSMLWLLMARQKINKFINKAQALKMNSRHSAI